MKVAIVGAGIAGLSCATRLREGGHLVSLFDKGRGPGGRMATRRVDTPAGEVAFDHGAQYVTARHPDFVAAMSAWASAGVVARWPAAGADAWVGTPGMNAIVKHLAANATVFWNHRVDRILRADAGWRLDDGGAGVFDAVVVATPAEQAAPLLAPHDPIMASEALSCRSTPCWTAMLAFAEPVGACQDVIRAAPPIAWAARNNAKPGRDGTEAWVVQADADWSIAHLESDPDQVTTALTAAVAEQVGTALPPLVARSAHRWRFARARAIDLGCLWNDDDRIGAAGDWLVAPRVESAWLSGRWLAERILADQN
ncbi:MAG TPA: FAD-dependent oxidoreductase [Sphingomonas sp.]|nr:FAD-dependent oxidoreductase [Sphingomonas sp.]